MNRIPMFDYLVQYHKIESDILAAVSRVLNSGRLVLGNEVRAFEGAFVDFLGGGGSAVGVNSGTDALAIALMALGVGPGDEVVTVANTAVPTVSAIRMTGAIPVFCDVDASTALMDLEQLAYCFSLKTKAVIPVHLFGNVVDVERIRSIIGNRDIRIIEDCAQAHGAQLRGQPAGTMGDASAFSFYPTKNLGAFGDAGLCYSNDTGLVKEMRRIRMYGFDDAYYSEREGINSRMDEIQAAVLNVKLARLGDNLEKRRKLAGRYNQLLDPAIERIKPGEYVDHAYHLYVIKVDERDRVRKELTRQGVDTGVHYPFPIHLMRAYRFLGYGEGTLSNTETLAKKILSLPMYPELPPESVENVSALVNRAMA